MLWIKYCSSYASLNVKLNLLLCEFTLFKYKLMKLISAKAACPQRTFQVLIFLSVLVLYSFFWSEFVGRLSQLEQKGRSEFNIFLHPIFTPLDPTYKCSSLTKQKLNAKTTETRLSLVLSFLKFII